ncbi:unnamed protein product [Rhodiola kirilowii]
MEVEGEVIRFDIFQGIKHPPQFATVHALDTLDDLVQEVKPESGADPLELALERAPKLELKPLLEHLKYAFLGENDTLPVNIKNRLETEHERRLFEVPSSNKLDIGWNLQISEVSAQPCACTAFYWRMELSLL